MAPLIFHRHRHSKSLIYMKGEVKCKLSETVIEGKRTMTAKEILENNASILPGVQPETS